MTQTQANSGKVEDGQTCHTAKIAAKRRRNLVGGFFSKLQNIGCAGRQSAIPLLQGRSLSTSGAGPASPESCDPSALSVLILCQRIVSLYWLETTSLCCIALQVVDYQWSA